MYNLILTLKSTQLSKRYNYEIILYSDLSFTETSIYLILNIIAQLKVILAECYTIEREPGETLKTHLVSCESTIQ